MQSSKKHSICQKLPCGSLGDGAATNLLTCNWEKNAKNKTNVPPDLILLVRETFFLNFLFTHQQTQVPSQGKFLLQLLIILFFFSLNKKLPVYFPVEFLQEPAATFLKWGASLA